MGYMYRKYFSCGLGKLFRGLYEVFTPNTSNPSNCSNTLNILKTLNTLNTPVSLNYSNVSKGSDCSYCPGGNMDELV